MGLKSNYQVKRITRAECEPFVIGIHYAHRWPSVSFAFGLFCGDELVGCVTYGSPASPWLCKGVCGEEYRRSVIELNRLTLTHNLKNEASMLVGASLKQLGRERNWIVVSYADTAHNHTGFIYQASNFLFTGTTKPRTDMAAKDGKHSRHHSGDRKNRVFRSAKHRYVTFVGDRRFKKEARKALKYGVVAYPK